MKVNVAMALMAVSMIFASCAKDGADGPAGPTGAQGNANVQSETFSVNPGDWSAVSGGFGVSIGTSIVTESIVNTGAVLVYFRATNNGPWIALPATQGSETVVYSYTPGTIQITQVGGTAATQTIGFKIVVIAASGMLAESGIDATNYEAIRDYLGLEE
jgi:hypothetical protein